MLYCFINKIEFLTQKIGIFGVGKSQGIVWVFVPKTQSVLSTQYSVVVCCFEMEVQNTTNIQIKCEICTESFSSKSYKNQHIKIVHGEEKI